MRKVICATFALIGLCAGAFGAPNYVSNPSFENFSSTTATFTGSGNGGNAPATNWMIWNNSTSATTVKVCPDDAGCPTVPIVSPQDGLHMLYVTTGGQFDGVWQQYLPTNTGPLSVISSAYLYVVSGTVQVATGNDGSTVPEMYDSTPSWQLLTWSNTFPSNRPANEVYFYSASVGGAQFFIDLVTVTDNPSGVPEPATFGLTALALSGAALLERRRRQHQ